MENNNQIFVRISFTRKDYINDTNQILIPYDESLRDDISQIKNFHTKEWIIFLKNDRSKWIYHRPESNGPAVEWVNGDKVYCLNGKRHRENGPAIELANGNKYYWLNGLCHRENGPAVIYSNGNKEYWLNSKHFKNESEYLKTLRKLHEK